MMKNLLVIMGVLAITTIIYGFDANRARQFHQYIDKCSKEAGDEAFAIRADTFYCALNKDGKVFDENGQYKKQQVMRLIEDAVADISDRIDAKDIFNKCYNNALKIGGSAARLRDSITKCSVEIVFLFDNPT